MTVRESESPAEPLRGERETERETERKALSYQGTRVPLFVVVIWLVFFVWGVYYLLRWIPQSWREWFSPGA